MVTIEARTVLLDHFLVAMAEGWLFGAYPDYWWPDTGAPGGPGPEWGPLPMAGPHGAYRCLMTREIS